jgi:hypothetical protein
MYLSYSYFIKHLKNHNQKALLGIIHTFKSELTLIGLIGLSLYLASSSEGKQFFINSDLIDEISNLLTH